STNTGKGTWGAPLNGLGMFSAVPGTGQATYTYVVGDGAITFPFNYTDLVDDPELVTISVSDNSAPSKSQFENQVLSVARAGLRFVNENESGLTINNWPTLVAGMPSSLYPGQGLLVQAAQASDDDPSVCLNIFSAGETVPVELAFEMIDRSVYASTVVP